MNLKLTLKITGGVSEFEKTVGLSEADPKLLDELFCGAYAHIKTQFPRTIEKVGEECESCSA